jgi:hypothetical protein
MALWGTSHFLTPAAAAGSSMGHEAISNASVGPTGSRLQGLDGCIAQVLCQAVQLPGLSRHLIKSAGLLPWLAGVAVGNLTAGGPSADPAMLSTLAAAAADTITVVGGLGQGVGVPPWAVCCLAKLLAGRIGLSRSRDPHHQQQQQQGSDVFAAYTQAAVHVAAAVLQEPAGGGVSAGSSGSNACQLRWALELLLLLLDAAPSPHAVQQLRQQLQLGLRQQLSAAVGAAVSGGSRGALGSESAARPVLLGLWQKLDAGLSAAGGV